MELDTGDWTMDRVPVLPPRLRPSTHVQPRSVQAPLLSFFAARPSTIADAA
jgi:hypothetical protein